MRSPLCWPVCRRHPIPGSLLDALPAGEPSIYDPLRTFAGAELKRLQEWREVRRALPSAGRVTGFLSFLLEARASRAEQRLIKVIGLLGNQAVMQLVARTLQQASSEVRATAVEALDTLGDKQLVKTFLPLLEDAQAGAEHNQGGPPQTELGLRRLIAGGDAWLEAVATAAAGELGLESLIPARQQLVLQSESLGGEAGGETLHSSGGTVETLPTLSLIKRTILLRDIPIFNGLAPDDLAQIAQIAQERWFADGAVLCREGVTGDELFIIAEGQVRVTRQTDGKEQVLAVRGTGDFVGEMTIIDSTPRFATVSALGDVRVLVISAEMFKAILRDRPEVSLAVMRALSHRLREQR